MPSDGTAAAVTATAATADRIGAAGGEPRRTELILGGQRSGKSRLAEERGLGWLEQARSHRVTLVATALAADDEMAERIAHHRESRPPAFATRESPWHLGEALRSDDAAHHLRIVDCLTLWLTNWLMPAPGVVLPGDWTDARRDLLDALAGARGPVILVSNEIGMGLIPMSREARRFVDTLGGLHRDLGRVADRVTLVVAGLEVAVK